MTDIHKMNMLHIFQILSMFDMLLSQKIIIVSRTAPHKRNFECFFIKISDMPAIYKKCGPFIVLQNSYVTYILHIFV